MTIRPVGTSAVAAVVLAGWILVQPVSEDPTPPPGRVLGVGANASSSNSPASPPAKRFTISGDVSDLFPGSHKMLTLRFDNPLNQDIIVVAASVQVVASDKPGCPTTAVIAPAFFATAEDPGTVVRRKSSATRAIPIAMRADAPHACSSATFSLAYSGSAVSP